MPDIYLTLFIMQAAATLIITVWIIAHLRKQSQIADLIEHSLHQEEHIINRVGLVVDELRKSNYFLSALTNRDMPKLAALPPLEKILAAHPKAAGNNDANAAGKLYVGNVDYSATETELADYFSRFGQIEFVNIPVNRYTGKARGFGFITFSSAIEAERAMALNGSEFKGRQIQVNFAKEKEQAMES